MNRDPSILIGVISSLGCDHVGLVAHGPPHMDVAVLQDSRGIVKDEIYGAVDMAFAIELPLGVYKKSVLVAAEAAAVEDGEVGPDPHSHSLVLCWACCVLKCHVPRPKTIRRHTCCQDNQTIKCSS